MRRREGLPHGQMFGRPLDQLSDIGTDMRTNVRLVVCAVVTWEWGKTSTEGKEIAFTLIPGVARHPRDTPWMTESVTNTEYSVFRIRVFAYSVFGIPYSRIRVFAYSRIPY